MRQSSKRGPKEDLLFSGSSHVLSCIVGRVLLGFVMGPGEGERERGGSPPEDINPWRRSVLSKLLFKQPKARCCGAHIFSGWKACEDFQIHSTREAGDPWC